MGVAAVREQWQKVGDTGRGSQRNFRQLGMLSLAMGRQFEAAHNLALANDPVSRLWLAKLAAANDQFEEAGTFLAQDYPTYWRVLLQRAAEVTLRGDMHEALVCYKIVALWNIGEEPSDLVVRGHVRQILGQYTAALSDFDQAIAHCPTCYQAYLYRGQTSLVSGTGTPNDIEADFLRAVTLAPDQRDAALSWGQLLQYRGRYDEAEVQFKRWMQFYPNDFEATWSLANIYCNTKRSNEGKYLLDEFSVRFPADAQSNQARLLQQLEQCQHSEPTR